MMKKIFRRLLFLFVCVFAAGGLSAKNSGIVTSTVPDALWLTDFAKASQFARELKRPMIVLFTGSDWCGWCKRLDHEIWRSSEFKKWAKANVVLVKIDFPRTSTLSKAEQTQNRDLGRRFNVSGFPTVLILSSDGKELGRTGYKKLSPQAYIRHLAEYFKK